MVGPLSARDGWPLSPDLEKFVINSGGHGFIIVSFGSNVASILSRKVVDMLAEAFGKLRQKVVWRLKGNSVIKSNNQSETRVYLLFPQPANADIFSAITAPETSDIRKYVCVFPQRKS